MNIYISAPITGRTEIDNDLVFEYAKTQLIYLGHKVISPWHISKLLPTLTHEQYMAIDKALIKNAADAVYFVSGWQHSAGCCEELEFCNENKIKTFHSLDELMAYEKEGHE